jgi:hypothetical protein
LRNLVHFHLFTALRFAAVGLQATLSKSFVLTTFPPHHRQTLLGFTKGRLTSRDLQNQSIGFTGARKSTGRPLTDLVWIHQTNQVGSLLLQVFLIQLGNLPKSVLLHRSGSLQHRQRLMGRTFISLKFAQKGIKLESETCHPSPSKAPAIFCNTSSVAG